MKSVQKTYVYLQKIGILDYLIVIWKYILGKSRYFLTYSFSRIQRYRTCIYNRMDFKILDSLIQIRDKIFETL